MDALLLNCSLTPGSEASKTQVPADVVLDALRVPDVEVTVPAV